MTLLGARLYAVESMMNHELGNIWTEAIVTCGEGKITKTLSQYRGCPVRDSNQVPSPHESKALPLLKSSRINVYYCASTLTSDR
jgi:hypothetical protein